MMFLSKPTGRKQGNSLLKVVDKENTTGKYGRRQLEEAIRRIKEYEGLKRIIVCTNSNLAVPKNYEFVGFTLYDRKINETESAYTGDYLYYEIVI